jgi:hypothetical protein
VSSRSSIGNFSGSFEGHWCSCSHRRSCHPILDSSFTDCVDVLLLLLLLFLFQSFDAVLDAVYKRMFMAAQSGLDSIVSARKRCANQPWFLFLFATHSSASASTRALTTSLGKEHFVAASGRSSSEISVFALRFLPPPW